MRIEICRIHDRIHEVHFTERKTSQRMHVVRGAPDEDPSNHQTRLCVAWNMVWHAKSSSEKGIHGPSKKPKLDDARKLRGIYFIDPENGEYDETI